MMETIPSGTILHGRAHYRIERVLGSGGFGHVYLAIELKTNQLYAMKEYFVSGSSGQAQLQHEAQMLGQLHHPNLPAFHEAFSEQGRYFVVLSYIEGNDLTDLIRIAVRRHDSISLSRIMEWIISMSDAVTFLHNQKPPLIHRDIKPDNIRIMPNNTAVLVDLGNAKEAADGARTLFFIRHQGTPGYAPPEQYPGGTGTDVRSDVYALGGTLYFALTTHEPPSVSTRNASAQQKLVDMPTLQELIKNNPPEEAAGQNQAKQFRLGSSKPEKPSQRHIHHLAQLATLPPAFLDQLNRVIIRAMAMKPRDRYQTVAEFSADLKKIMAALPTAPKLQPPSSRPFDPNSTQPDLPQLFEAIQKENMERAASNPAATNPATNPPVQPISMPVPVSALAPTPISTPTPKCPNCNRPLTTSASFCPNCGARVHPVSPTNIAPATGEAPKSAVPNKSSAHDVSLDKTEIIPPKPQLRTFIPTTSRPGIETSPSITITPSPKQTMVPTQTQSQSKSTMIYPPVQNNPNNPPITQVSSTPVQSPGAKVTSSPSFLRNSIIIVAAIALVAIILAVILIVLLSHGGTPAHNSHSFQLVDSSVAQVIIHHERNITLSTTAAFAHSFPGIWTRSSSVFAAPGIS